MTESVKHKGIGDELELKFTNLFLEVTKELQRVKIWTDETPDEKTGKKQWDNLFEKTLKELYVLYGYFVEYEPNDKEVKYFIEGNPLNKANPDFIPPYIPFFESTNKKISDGLNQALNKAETKFSSEIKSPKVYQHLPVQPKSRTSFKDFELISDKCLNCHVPCEIRSNNDYYVVLFDEVAFFQFAYTTLNKTEIFQHYIGQEKIFLKYLLKFAIGIESKLSQNILFIHLGLLSADQLNWKTKQEFSIRKKIDEIVEKHYVNTTWLNETNTILIQLVNDFITKTKTFPIYKRESTITDLEILKHVSRFDIEASFEIKDTDCKSIFHDVFIFPIYTQKAEKVFTIKCVQDEELDVHSPILLVLYIKTRKYIDGELDEDESSVDGFQLTKEITKLFAEKIIQEDYLKNIVRKETRHQATRAAISQVMARNMSHNIGSHVLSKFKDEKEICDVCIAGNKDTQFIGEANFYAGSDYLNKGSYLIAYFNEYLKNRMDFLADIATTDPVMESSMYLFRDILKGFDKNRILLNRISGVSIDRKFKIIVPDKNGETINNLNHSDDPLLSIPNEILGAQAFYILLENIIRNIYKHGNPDKDIEIKIEVIDYEKDTSFYEISIYDNIVKENIDDAVTNRNTSFNDSVLKNGKALRPNNLGTIEMDVCAAYLRCLPIISIENPDFDLQEDNRTDIPRLIYAYKHKLSDTEFSLGYKLCISKPKEILVVTDSTSKFSIKDCINEKELAKTGIKVIAKDELDKSEAIYNHQILYSLVSGDELNTILEKKQAMLPKRVVYSSNHVSLESSEKFIESVWEQYALKFFNESSKCYCIINGENLKKHINLTSNGIELLSKCNTTDCHTTYIDNHNQEWAKKDNWNYYDMACSQSKINKLKDAILWDDNKRLAAEYIEVIKTKVVLLDERIQQNISNENRKYTANGLETPLTEYFEKQKLFIPKQSDCDLNEVSFGTLAISDCENGNTISSHICRYIKAHLTGIEKPDFVIIHLGILEKMLPSSEDKKQDNIKDLINLLFKEERKRLVVTSGRGKPNNLPEDIPFLPLALVQNAVETLFDKFLFTKILFNSRKSV